MKIGITGANGQLGRSLISICSQSGLPTVAISRGRLSTFAHRANADYLDGLGITHLIHCAADTNVERNESDPDTAYLGNTLLSEALARTCRTINCRMTFISSTGLYGNHQDEPYTEFSTAIPTTVHHRSKLLAENAVRALLPEALIIRTGWLFGGDPHNPKNFVVNRLRDLQSATSALPGNAEQFGCPTHVLDVNRRILDLIDQDYSGIFNCVNTGMASRYDYLLAIAKAVNSSTEIVPVPASAFHRRAPVSHNETALNYKFQLLQWPDLPHWQDRLTDYIKSLSLNN